MKQATKRSVRNPFYERVRRTGIRLVISAEPLPHGKRKPSNPYLERIEKAGGVVLRVGRGRPRKGQEVGPTVPKSVRLPAGVWRRLDAQAAREGLTRHAAMRQAVLIWLRS